VFAIVKKRAHANNRERSLLLNRPQNIHVSLIFTVEYAMHLIWALILTIYFSVNPIRLTNSDFALFRSLNLETLILTTDTAPEVFYFTKRTVKER
jgi:hypothetical protein